MASMATLCEDPVSQLKELARRPGRTGDLRVWPISPSLFACLHESYHKFPSVNGEPRLQGQGRGRGQCLPSAFSRHAVRLRFLQGVREGKRGLMIRRCK
jgi:hypothetical protein